jgi:hypothetical protein
MAIGMVGSRLASATMGHYDGNRRGPIAAGLGDVADAGPRPLQKVDA